MTHSLSGHVFLLFYGSNRSLECNNGFRNSLRRQ
jgi:hypothetical protein